MSDPIDRQVAIDILMKEWKTYKDYPYVSHVRHGLEIAIAILENKVPSAQPEIVRCRECKWHDGVRCFRWNSTIITGFDDFCSNGERRQDG